MGDQPNIVWVMTDQHRADLTAVVGAAGPVMPTLRTLAERGTTFSTAYTSFPACVPARVSLLTGRFPSAHQVRQNSTGDEAYFAADLLDVLHGAGYESFFAGKPHMHRHREHFDHFRGPYMHTDGPESCADHEKFDRWLSGLDHGVADRPTPFPVEMQLAHRIVDDVLEDLQAARPDGPTERPFFCWVSFPEPHNPYQVPEPYYSMFDDVAAAHVRGAGPEVVGELSWRYQWLRNLIQEKRPGYDEDWRRYFAVYLGMLRMVDDQVARLLNGLRDHLGNTIVVFLADHGDYVGEYGLQRKGAGLSDALTRIPLILAGPGIPHGETRCEVVSIVDLMPTMCGLLGLDLPAGTQGRDLEPLISRSRDPGDEFKTAYVESGYGGVSYNVDDRPALHFAYQGASFDELNSVTQSGQERMVRRGDLKLIMDDRGRTWLYDLRSDPSEVHNLAGDPARAADLHELTQWLARWMIRVGDDLPVGRYTPLLASHNWRWAPGPHLSQGQLPQQPSETRSTKE